MTNQQKMAIALEYVGLHLLRDIALWEPLDVLGDEKLLSIFSNLEEGLYGEVTSDEETDEDGNIISPATRYSVEIYRYESKYCAAVEFEWYA